MSRSALVPCALAVIFPALTALNTAAPAAVAAPAANLSRPYVLALGDMMAFTMSQQLAVVKSVDLSPLPPITFNYDATSRKIVVSVYGDPHGATLYKSAQASVHQAEFSLEYFRGKVFPVLAEMVGKTYGVSPTDSDLTLIYFDRTSNMKEVIRRESDRYLVAQ
jgi:hypothetical protein